MLVSAIKHRFSRRQLTFTANIRNLRDAPNASDSKSKGHRAPGRNATCFVPRDPRACLRPLCRLTPNFSSVLAIRLLMGHEHSFAFQQHSDPAITEPTPFAGNRLHLFGNFRIIPLSCIFNALPGSGRVITPDGLGVDIRCPATVSHQICLIPTYPRYQGR